MGSFEEILKKTYVFDPDTGCWQRSGAEDFKYSDGDVVENHILSIIQQAKDLGSNSFELGQQCVDWPTTYHLSAKRANLLRPVKKILKGRILEIGAGLGAVTRFLGEEGGEVLALEGSMRRASAIRARCRNLSNVTVLAESFHQFNVKAEFDVVVLVGVLEYSRQFFVSEEGDPVDVMLKHVRGFLRPGGVLVLAIENQLGLKYFAGSPEDHTGISMYGIEDLYGDDTVVTFGQKELQQRLTSARFPAQNWWFPFPDYKLPVTVLSSRIDDHEADFSPLLAHSVGADMQISGGRFFSLEQAWGVIARNGLVSSHANSFLVLASDEENSILVDDGRILGYYYSLNRRPEFAKEMIFQDIGKGKVEVKKRALFPDPPSMEDSPVSIELNNEEFLAGKNWQSRLYGILNKPGWSVKDVEGWALPWYDAMLNHGNITAEKDKLTAEYHLPGNLFDAIPRNLIMTKEQGPRFFDQEWRLNLDIELGYLLFRSIYLELAVITNVARPADGTPLNIFKLFQSVVRSLGIQVNSDDLARYVSLESDVLNWVAGLRKWHTLQSLLELSLTIRVLTPENARREDPLTLRRILGGIFQRFRNLVKRLVSRSAESTT